MITTILLILTAVLWGLSPIIEKIGLGRVEPIMAVAIRSFAISTVLAIGMIFTGRIKELANVDIKMVALFSLSGILAGLLGMWAYFTVLRLQPTSKIVPIIAAYPLITVVLSMIILREGVTAGRLLGTVLIVVGIWLVKGIS